MRLDVNFVEAVDWKKESSMDPRFIAGSIGVLVLMVFGAYYMALLSELSGLEDDCTNLKTSITTLEKSSKKIEVSKKNNAFFTNVVLADLKLKAEQRVVFSRCLLALQNCVTDKMFFTDLRLHPNRRKPDPKHRPKEGEPPQKHTIGYELILEGHVLGKKARNVIGSFPGKIRGAFDKVRDDFPDNPQVQVDDVGGLKVYENIDKGGENGYEFIIRCAFDRF